MALDRAGDAGLSQNTADFDVTGRVWYYPKCVEGYVVYTTMRALVILLWVVSLAVQSSSVEGADFFKKLFQKKSAGSVLELSNDEMISGLKEALAKGVQHAVTNLGRPDGFLSDKEVKIPFPESLKKVEKTLRTLHQDKLADDFVATMNRAAESAVPEAAEVLGDSVKQMTLSDAKGILTGADDAATECFRRTSQTNLHNRFLPIVEKATASSGVTAAYKKVTDVGGFGGIGAALFGRDTFSIDDYITRKTLDGLFVKIAEQEKLIRENPAARTTELLQKVFAAAKK